MRPSKKDELVEKALAVFEADGFHATGVDRLARAIGMSKTSIYNHFRTKEELILAALHLKETRFAHWLVARIESAGDAPEAQMLAIFDALDEWFARPDFAGCAFIKAAAEYQNAADPIRLQAQAQKRAILAHVAALARRCGATAPDDLAAELELLIEGAIIAAQLQMFPRPAARAKRAAQTLMDAALSPRSGRSRAE